MKKYYSVALGAALFSASAFGQTDVRQGLVAYWPLDQVTGATTPDLINGNDLELVEMTEANLTPGQKGQALTFDGVTQYAFRITDPAEPDTGLPITKHTAFTVSMWVNAVGQGQSDRRFFSEGNTSGANNNALFNLGTHNAGTDNAVNVYVRGDGGAAPLPHVRSTQQPLDGTWHHLVWVDNNGSVQLYVDGELDPTNFNYTRVPLTATSTSIGAILRATAAAYYAGSVDDVALWERALTAAEVQNIHTNGIVTPIPQLPAYITSQPTNVTSALGGKATFRVAATGSRPVSYQWFKGTEAIAGMTNPTFTIFNVASTNAGSYRVDVTTPGGTISSDVVQLTVPADPAPNTRAGLVSYWPLDSGSTSTPDLYSKNDMTLVNMDASNFVEGKRTNALSFDGFEEYTFRSTGASIYNNPSYTVGFWVKGDYTDQLDRRVFAEGSTANNTPLVTFGTDNTGTTPSLNVYIRNDANAAVVNARKSTRPVFDGTWHHVAWIDDNGQARLYIDGVLDETDFSYTRAALTANTTTLGGILRAGPSHYFAGAMDEVALWSRPITYTELQEVIATGLSGPVAAIPPTFTVHPVGATVYQGDRLVLSATAGGTSPLSYQWVLDGVAIPGATNRVINLSNLQPSQSGFYSVTVSNEAGSVDSNEARIGVIPVTGIRTGLVAHWPFDTVNGTTTPDVANGNDLTLTNMDAGALVEGKVGQALSFNGVDSYAFRIHTNENSGLPIFHHRAYTVSFWVNAVGVGQNDRRVYSEGSRTNANPLLNIGTDNTGATGSVDLYIRYLAGNPVNHRKSVAEPYDGTWHHIAWTDNNGVATLYIDGNPDPTDFNYTRSGQFPADVTSVGAILRATAGAYFAGTVDEVAVWSRALSEDEVRQVIATGTEGGSGGGNIHIASIMQEAGKVRLTVDAASDTSALTVQQTHDLRNPVWAPVTGVTWTENNGQKIAEFNAPAEATTFYRVAGPAGSGPAAPVFEDTFETATAGWTHGGIGDSWSRGAPTSGPGVAYSGESVWAVGLTNAYANDTMQWLRSPSISLVNATNARVSFYEFRDMDAADMTEVNIKDAADPDGAPLAQLSSNTGSRAAWTRRSFAVPAEALGRNVIFEFVFTSDSANALPQSGWFIDDFRVQN